MRVCSMLLWKFCACVGMDGCARTCDGRGELRHGQCQRYAGREQLELHEWHARDLISTAPPQETVFLHVHMME